MKILFHLSLKMSCKIRQKKAVVKWEKNVCLQLIYKMMKPLKALNNIRNLGSTLAVFTSVNNFIIV